MSVRWQSIWLVACATWATTAWAGPQHWGFGFGYLVTIEENAAGERALSVYEPPLRVKDGEWLLRWRDASGQYKELRQLRVAVGNFWPQAIGKEHVLAITSGYDGRLDGAILDPPEVFSTRAWSVRERVSLPQSPESKSLWVDLLLGTAAGDVLGAGHDQLITLHEVGTSPCAGMVRIFDPPAEPGGGEWTLAGEVRLHHSLGRCARSVAVGDFWGEGRDTIALLVGSGRPRGLVYLRAEFTPQGKLELREIRAELVEDLPEREDMFVAADFLKDGFAYLATADWQPAIGSGPPGFRPETIDATAIYVRTAPRLAEQRFNTCWVRPDETFAGAKLTDQKVGESKRIITGRRQAPFGKVIAAGAGRIFGYVLPSCDERKEKIWKPWKYHGYNDVEISFAHRTPVYRLGVPKKWQDGNWPWEPDDHFGWPRKDEEVTYEINIKNNGKEPIPAGQVTLRAWVAVKDRNADVLPGEGTKGSRDQGIKADFMFTIDQAIPPFDPAKPEYTVVKIPLKWPFDLVQPEDWTWKKLNVRDIGERWLIVRLDYDGDENERNNRYELALNGLLFRPVFRFDEGAPTEIDPLAWENKAPKLNTLVYRAPTITGDPESKEYIARKLADAVQCMWERSRTSGGEDVWQRVVFDGYRKSLGTTADRELDWSYYEGPRDLDLWLGLWGDWERFNPKDGGAELHETGHLFHRIGDLYHYFIFPTTLRKIRMADGAQDRPEVGAPAQDRPEVGAPVQMYTYAWGLDSFCSGHAIIGEAACDLHRYIEGARYGLGWGWHRMLPGKIKVRVLDRDGQPVPDAKVSCWGYPNCEKPYSTGTTDAGGLWDPGINKQPGDAFAPFNIPQYNDPILDSTAQVFTVDLPGYSDFMIWGAEDTHAHSRYTLMQESLRQRAGWTWDFRTLYKAGAPVPKFDVTCGVRGREVVLQVDGKPGGDRVFRLYRRREPTYTYERIAEQQIDVRGESWSKLGAVVDYQLPMRGPSVRFTDDMGAADWYMSGRYRAAYYVTEQAGAIESLPKRVYGIAIEHANGISDLGDGRLMVAANCGKAEPFGVLFQGTTPVEEYIKHFRFGHTAAKIVASKENPQRFYATLTASDMPWGADRFFDLIQFDKPDRHTARYPVVQVIAECDVTKFTSQTPYIVAIRPDPDARAAINAGDWALAGDQRARILAAEPFANTLTLDKPVFAEGQKDGLHLRIEFGAGTPGDNTELRELKNPRGLAVVQGDDGREYVVIADTGNGRVVVWSGEGKFVAQINGTDLQKQTFRPVAVAADPSQTDRFFVLDRQADQQSRLYHLRLFLVLGECTILRVDDYPLVLGPYPIPVEVGDAAQGPEIGLAVAREPAGGALIVAVTDGTQGRVVELRPFSYKVVNGRMESAAETVGTFTQALGAFVGDAKLVNPTDVAYTVENGELRLYAVDDHNRVVRLR